MTDQDHLETEAPEADAAEQAADALPPETDDTPVDEDSRTVSFEDDYR